MPQRLTAPVRVAKGTRQARPIEMMRILYWHEERNKNFFAEAEILPVRQVGWKLIFHSECHDKMIALFLGEQSSASR